MSNFDTVKSITTNIETVLKGQGAEFLPAVIEDLELIPLSTIPCGQIFYRGEQFEYGHNEKPEFAEIRFLLRIILRDRDPRNLTRDAQDWTHRVRDGLTLPALNVGDLAASKLVSRVTTESVEVEYNGDRAVLGCATLVRYREV